MELKDVASLVHFRELHFLPRVIFFIGAVCFIGSFFVKLLILGLVGVGLMLSASTLNLVINAALRFYDSLEQKIFDIPWALLFQAFLALAITLSHDAVDILLLSSWGNASVSSTAPEVD